MFCHSSTGREAQAGCCGILHHLHTLLSITAEVQGTLALQPQNQSESHSKVLQIKQRAASPVRGSERDDSKRLEGGPCVPASGLRARRAATRLSTRPRCAKLSN